MAFISQGVLKGLSAVTAFVMASSASPISEKAERVTLAAPINPPKPAFALKMPVKEMAATLPAPEAIPPQEPVDFIKQAVDALRIDFLNRVATSRQTIFNTCFTRTNAPVDMGNVMLIRRSSGYIHNASYRESATDYSLQPIIVLDAGHGGGEPGASRAGLVEQNIVYSVTTKLKNALERDGMYVVETRDRNFNASYRFRDQPFALQWRAELSHMLATKFPQRPVLFLSIHANTSPLPETNGAEVYFYDGSEYDSPSGKFARAIASHYKSPHGIDLRKENFAVLRCQDEKTPAVLLELGYLTHEAERDYLASLTKNGSASDKAIGQITDGIRSFIRKMRDEQKPDDPVVVADAGSSIPRLLTP